MQSRRVILAVLIVDARTGMSARRCRCDACVVSLCLWCSVSSLLVAVRAVCTGGIVEKSLRSTGMSYRNR